MDKILDGRVALVTGAGRGFGAGIARGLAQAGAHVCITDINAAELEATEREILGDRLVGNSKVLAQIADVSDFGQMEAAVAATVARWGRLDIVVNNAAMMPLVSFADTDPGFLFEKACLNVFETSSHTIIPTATPWSIPSEISSFPTVTRIPLLEAP